jgi:hypothetical protein
MHLVTKKKHLLFGSRGFKKLDINKKKKKKKKVRP